MVAAMYIEAVPNRNSPPAILLRESYREGSKVKKRTLCNLSGWPKDLVDGFKTLLKGGTAVPAGPGAFTIRRALPHGHVAAVLGTLRRIGLDRILGPAGNRCRDLVVAMVVSRVTAPTSKLATAKALSPDTAASSLGEILGLGAVGEDDLYTALDWLRERQPAVEPALAKRHLAGGTLVLYDVSSSYVEGRCCELARLGYSRDGKKGKMQIVYGLLCAADGCPVAIEVFEGNTADPTTLSVQITKLKERFELDHVVLVGDRGLITQARIEKDLGPAGLDWITALRAPAIRALVEDGALQLSLFDQRDIAAILSPDYPGERLIVCRNLELARERARKREDLRRATERDLAAIESAVGRRRRPARRQSASGSARCWTATRWPSTSNWPSATTTSASPARTRPSPPRRRSMASTSSAPAFPPPPSTILGPSGPTRRSPSSSTPSAASRPSTSTSGRSSTGSSPGSEPMSSCACSPTMSSGTCAPASPPCSTTTTARAPRP